MKYFSKETPRLIGIALGKLPATSRNLVKDYIESLEEWVEEASNEDFYGTEGWKHNLGLED